ncbi:MAG: roadblock/LC7 domain-containing protein [Thermoleophilia bacterium]|nr:roadblock/LC7 domain-containing protein [Thermoleophilia bacterium]
MTPNEALAELLTFSAQVRDVAVLGESGFVLASTGTVERGEQLARVAADLVKAAGDVRPGAELARIEISSEGAEVFLVRDAGRTAIATTAPETIAGLMIYDLRTMLGRVDAEPAPPRPRKKKASDDA